MRILHFIKKHADVIVILMLLLIFGLNSVMKQLKNKTDDPRKKVVEVAVVKQVCVNGDEAECITFQKPTFVKINIVRDENAGVILIEPKR